jgi:hypothetical protein
MKPTLISISAVSLLAALAIPAQILAQEEHENKREHLHYRIKDLGKVGPPPGQAYVIANNGLISGRRPFTTAQCTPSSGTKD